MPRIAVIFFVFLVVTFTAAVTSSCSGRDTEATPFTNARAAVIHDPETGCEYVITPTGGVTPRLSVGGKPICRPHDTNN